MTELLEVDTYDISYTDDKKKQTDVRAYFIKEMNIEINVIQNVGSVTGGSIPMIQIISTTEPIILKIKADIVPHRIKISKEWVNECFEYYKLKNSLKDTKLKLFFKSPTQKTIDDLTTDEFNAGFNCFMTKDYIQGIKHFKQCLKILENDKKNNTYKISQYNIACCYALLNKVNKAIKWLKKAVNNEYTDWCSTIKDKDFENIINNDEIVNIIKKMIEKNPKINNKKIDEDVINFLQRHDIHI